MRVTCLSARLGAGCWGQIRNRLLTAAEPEQQIIPSSVRLWFEQIDLSSSVFFRSVTHFHDKAKHQNPPMMDVLTRSSTQFAVCVYVCVWLRAGGSGSSTDSAGQSRRGICPRSKPTGL